MSTNTGGPAFPIVVGDQMTQGMTLRDYFAAKAMQGIMTDTDMTMGVDKIAAWSYRQADAMIAARNQ